MRISSQHSLLQAAEASSHCILHSLRGSLALMTLTHLALPFLQPLTLVSLNMLLLPEQVTSVPVSAPLHCSSPWLPAPSWTFTRPSL